VDYELAYSKKIFPEQSTVNKFGQVKVEE